MIKIKNTDVAIEIFIEAAIKHAESTSNGNYKVANKNYDKIIKAIAFLKQSDKLYTLNDLLEHPSVGVRIWASTYLLSLNEERALMILENIVNEERGIHSLIAQTTLNEWGKGTLKI